MTRHPRIPEPLAHSIGRLLLDEAADEETQATVVPWPDLETFVNIQRCWPLVVAAMGSNWPYGSSQWSHAVDAAMTSLAGCLVLDRAALALATQLQEDGLEFALTKGTAFAHVLWAAPAWRSFGDVDIVVRRTDLPRIVQVLERSGSRLHGADPSAPGIASFAKSVTYQSQANVELDIHMSLCDGPFSFQLREAELLEETRLLPLGGAEIPTLSPQTLFIHAGLHAVLPSDHRRLLPLVDVAMGLTRGGLDPAVTIQLAERWGVGAVVADSVNQATSVFGLPRETALSQWAANRVTSNRERRWLRVYAATGTRGTLLQTVAKLEAQRTWCGRARYCHRIVRGPGTWRDRATAVRQRLRTRSRDLIVS